MTKFVHIVQVHPVELGLPNLHKVKAEKEFDTENEAKLWLHMFNYTEQIVNDNDLEAVYYGCVNDETGELV
jgi:hypothetical protein